MDINQLVSHIDAEVIAQDTLDFIKIPSETGQESEGCRFVVDLLNREGFEPIIDEAAPGRNNVYALVKGAADARGADSRALMLNGHIDTIPIGASTPPGREGDWLVGRGAEDMKGGVVAIVHAASALRKAGVSLAGDLWLTAVVGHEEGKEGTRRLIEHLRSGKMRPEAIVIAEGPAAIWLSSLGSTVFTITMTSNLGPIHTSRVPYADNPARWLGELLVEFQRLEERFAGSPPHPLCGREQLNIGIASAGDYYNRLPTPVTVAGQWRWKPGKSFQDVQAELESLCQDICARSGLSYEISYEGPREPFETTASDPIVMALKTAGERVSGSTPDIVGRAVVGDANLFVNDGGVTTVYYGATRGEPTAHSDDERVSVGALAHCAGVYALTAMLYCGVVE